MWHTVLYILSSLSAIYFVCILNWIFFKEIQSNSWYIISGSARFTEVPPSVLYVSIGGTARFVWDYTVDNRTYVFDAYSPTCSFYNANNIDFLIGQENVFNKWKWVINIATCPARLLNPVRVSKESTATLVIYSVTSADSGTYGCTLVLTTARLIISKVQLVVTCKYAIQVFPFSLCIRVLLDG
jgi:hypothetical protein